MSASSGPVTLINVFTVPLAHSEPFLRRWRDNAAVMARCGGFRYADMFQAVHDDVELRFVNVAHWDDEQSLLDAQAAPDFRDAVRRLVSDPLLNITARPAAYQVAAAVEPTRPDDDPD